MNNSYRIDVKNFGPIVRASVDFRPLTVFIGPSNTGKSYLAVLLYALHKCLSEIDVPVNISEIQGRMNHSFDLSISLSEIEKSLIDWVAMVSNGNSISRTSIPEHLVEAIRLILEEAEGLDLVLYNEIRRCFGVHDLGELVRRTGSSKKSSITLKVARAGKSDRVRYDFKFRSSGYRLSGKISTTESSSWKLDLSDAPVLLAHRTNTPHKLNIAGRMDLMEVLDNLFQSLTEPASRRAYYLPADRTGVMHSHQAVVGAIVQNASMAGLRPSPNVPMLSGVVADFLTLMIGIGSKRQSRRRSRKAMKLAAPLEGNLLGGTVRVESSEAGYPAFAYRPKGWQDDLPLMRASSMVSELAPVVLYLRHIVQPGDVLIIEEPEAHLHPAMQAAFARELVRLVHAGVRIVMTTHSEWFLEQIGNLVRLSDLPKAKRRGLDGADCALDPSDVGAWLFRPSNRPKGSIVEEITLDAETGLYPTGYDAVSETLYNESAVIYNRIQENR